MPQRFGTRTRRGLEVLLFARVSRGFGFPACFGRQVENKGQSWLFIWSLSWVFDLTLAGCRPDETDDVETDDFEIVGPTVVMDLVEECTGTKVQLSSLEDETPFGVSTSELLTLLPPRQQSQFKWASPDGPIIFHRFGDATVELAFEITVDPEDANPAYLDSNACPPNVSCVGYCASRMEVDAQLQLNLSDASFQETLPIRLGIIKRRRNRGYEFRVHHVLDLSQMQGSFREGSFSFDPEEPGWTWYKPPILQAELWPRAIEQGLEPFRGRIFMTPIAPDGMLWFNSIGVWPPP